MQNNEKVMCYLEDRIPDMATKAAELAYWHTLATGSSVLEVIDNDVLVETFPDGTQKIIKQLEPLTHVVYGQILEV